jgi:DNA-binding MarR family transcriptional regulator
VSITAASAPPGSVPAWQEGFVEKFGLLAEAGLPRSVARMLGWLIICEPRHQSAQQLKTTLKLSGGAVSSGASILVRAGFATRITFPGDRRTYYQFEPHGWQRLLRSRIEILGQARSIAEQALTASGDRSHGRLREMRDFYAWFESSLTRLVDEFGKAGERPGWARHPPEVRGRQPRR